MKHDPRSSLRRWVARFTLYTGTAMTALLLIPAGILAGLIYSIWLLTDRLLAAVEKSSGTS